jgi:tryptophan 2,3-dioxygenase
MSSPDPDFYYADYLKLAALLAAQQPESARQGRPAHDEMLFIVVHQTYELWFKQILHELDRIQADFGGDVVEDEYLGRIVHGLERINEILKLLIQQLEVLETMTPLDFLDFRDFLFPASGFQSTQFRLIENPAGPLARESLRLRRQTLRRDASQIRPRPGRRHRTRAEADRPARPLAFAHALRAPARLRFLA